MKVKFFLCINSELNTKPKFSDSETYQERSRSQLQIQLKLLTSIVELASKEAADVLPVVICGEDFFQGEKLASAEERKRKNGQCYDRDVGYQFIANELIELSKMYQTVLIIPGSMYLSVLVETDKIVARYRQDVSKNIRGTVYVQNIAPVLFEGQLLRIIKKGGFLQEKFLVSKNKIGMKALDSSAEHEEALSRNNVLEVPWYAEDELCDLNEGLIFLGETPLPGEEHLINTLCIAHDDLFSRVFTVRGFDFGMEICADHKRKLLIDENLDFHIVSSHGMLGRYQYSDDICVQNGYMVQADAASEMLTGIRLSGGGSVQLQELECVSASGQFIYRESPALEAIRHQRRRQQEEKMELLIEFIVNSCSTVSSANGARFAGRKPPYVQSLIDICSRYRNKLIGLESELREIVRVSTEFKTVPIIGKIKYKAEQLLDLVNPDVSDAEPCSPR